MADTDVKAAEIIASGGNIIDSGEVCKDCGRTITLVYIPFGGLMIPRKCQCAVIREDSERKEHISRGKPLIQAAMLRESGIPRRWRDSGGFSPLQEQEDAFRVAREFTKNICKGANMYGSGLMLCGAAGCGKTHLAAAIARSVIMGWTISDRDAESAGASGFAPDRVFAPVRFSGTVDLLSRIRNTYDNNGGGSCHDIIAVYQHAPLAVLDDLGTERPSEWVNERLFEIIDWRYSERLPIVITTNATPAELKSRLGARISDRLREMCRVVVIGGGSRRPTAG